MLLLLPLWPFLACADETLSVALPECSARLERRSAEAEGVVVRPGCPLSMDALATLLDAAFRWMPAGDARPVHTIYLGRLESYPEWAEQLALAAARSRRWNGRTGKPRGPAESSNAVVAELLGGPAFPEALRKVCIRWGLKPRIGSVEKVLVFPARQALRTRPAAIPPDALLPVDAQVWLNLKPNPPPGSPAPED